MGAWLRLEASVPEAPSCCPPISAKVSLQTLEPLSWGLDSNFSSATD